MKGCVGDPLPPRCAILCCRLCCDWRACRVLHLSCMSLRLQVLGEVLSAVRCVGTAAVHCDRAVLFKAAQD